MRLLLDESIPSRFRRALPSHMVRTVVEMGWSGVKNGRLWALAANQFDAFITVDKNLPYQQNLGTLPIAVVVLDAGSIELPALPQLIPALEVKLASLQPRAYAFISEAPGAEADAHRRSSIVRSMSNQCAGVRPLAER
jgi:predicted nuclease of predicted toxin-antitoxin system